MAWLAILGIANAVVSVYYYWNVVRCMYLLEPRERVPMQPAPSLRAALAVAVLGTIGLLLFAEGFLQVLGRGA
jgi:NADH:ubiquinone oxidoreductase subunit 2 (subunit N)